MYLSEKSGSEAGKEVSIELASGTFQVLWVPHTNAVAQSWLRSIHHYIFLADPRTEHAIGEPKASNGAIVQVALDSMMHFETVREHGHVAEVVSNGSHFDLRQLFDFPYKRSVLLMLPRERFFRMDVL